MGAACRGGGGGRVAASTCTSLRGCASALQPPTMKSWSPSTTAACAKRPDGSRPLHPHTFSMIQGIAQDMPHAIACATGPHDSCPMQARLLSPKQHNIDPRQDDFIWRVWKFGSGFDFKCRGRLAC